MYRRDVHNIAKTYDIRDLVILSCNVKEECESLKALSVSFFICDCRRSGAAKWETYLGACGADVLRPWSFARA